MEWLFISVVVILLISVIVGIYKGAIKICVSLLTTIVTLVVVFFLTPYVAKILEKATPLDDIIEQQVISTMAKYSTNLMTDEASMGLNEDAIRQVLNAVGVSEAKLEEHGISIEDIANGTVSGQDLKELGISDQVLAGLEEGKNALEKELQEAEVPKDIQSKVIENAQMPEVFKQLLTANNNDEGYEKLGATTFGQYVAKYLSRLVLNIISFIGLFLIITILARAIIFALDIIADLPVLGVLNRLAGGALGAFGALIIIWFLFLIFALAYTAGFGEGIYAMIRENEWLSFIYDHNPIMTMVTKI